jgi:CRISPR-associated protein Cas1
LAWRTILIQNPAKLALAKGQLQISTDSGNFTFPLEDIAVLILESPQINLSSSLLAACQDHGLGVVTCGSTHMPNGLLLPFHSHSRQTRVGLMQINWKEPLQKRLWQKVVISKITNQADCLMAARGEESAKRLYALASKVNSGDPENIEAQAARDYWPKLFGPNFRRHAPDAVNAALNYGYAILRAFIARSQVAYGLLPCFGFHHSGELNAFNLTDDVMEVLRPSVDWHVFQMLGANQLSLDDANLSVEQRQNLAKIGNIRASYAGQIYTITTLADKLAEGLVAAIEAKTPALFLTPEFYLSENDADKR